MKEASVLSYPLRVSEDSGQTGRMPRLIWVFAGRTCHFVGFVMLRLSYKLLLRPVAHIQTFKLIILVLHVPQSCSCSTGSLTFRPGRLSQSGANLTANQGVAGSSFRPAAFFRWNFGHEKQFYDYFHSSADSRRLVVSYWRKNGN